MSNIWKESNKNHKAPTSKTNTISNENATHSYTDEEKYGFVDWINSVLTKNDSQHLPLNPENDSLFKCLDDGIILCKLINVSVPNTIDERAMNKTNLNAFRKGENLVLALNSSRSIGCNVVNVSPGDLMEGRQHLILGLLWQVIKIGLLSNINLKEHPELYHLLEPGETLETFSCLPSEQILLRWINYHLKGAGSNRRVNNFGSDISDSEAYTILLKQIAPKEKNVDLSPLQERDLKVRAEKMLNQAEKIDCRKFVRAHDICNGNNKLNLAFVANLFNNYPGLEKIEIQEEVVEEGREEKIYRNWMNSLGVKPYVHNLRDDLGDGIVILQLLDEIKKGIVNWNVVNMPPYKALGQNIKKIENCNYAIELASQLKFSLVGIEGNDIFTRNRTLVLGLIWQVMRSYILGILSKLSGVDKPISDAEILKWVNASIPEKLKISGWKDEKIKNSIIIAHLIEHVKPGTIDFSILKETGSEKDYLDNASYVVSCARKVGARAFTHPEQIVSSDPKMTMCLFATLMVVALGK